MANVFVSSVIRGFEEERECARRAIEALRLTPVMAENFGAQTVSPHDACLKGVEDADVYLGLLGARYGSETNSGLSPTEQEYRHAIELQKDIVILVDKCDRDPQQDRFVNQILQFESGHMAGFFSSRDELMFLATQALSDYCREQESGIGRDRAKSIQHSALIDLADRLRETSLVLAAIPADARCAIPMELIVSQQMRDDVQQRLLFGNTRLFEPALGLTLRDFKNGYSVLQGNEYEPKNEVLVDSSGALTWIHRLEDAGVHYASAFVIDRGQVHASISAYLRFVSWFFEQFGKPKARRGFISASICNIGHCRFGTRPTESRAIKLGTGAIDDPLLIPELPEEILLPRVPLDATTTRLMANFEQAFRAAGRHADF